MSSYMEAEGQSISIDNQSSRLGANYDFIQILLQANRPVAMIKVVEELTKIKLVQIQIIPEVHGNGLGTKLISALIEIAKKKQLPIELSVLKSNPAFSLYDRIGFEVYQEKEHSYEMRYSINPC